MIDGSNVDSWNAFLEERDAIFTDIASAGIEGVSLLDGDVHVSRARWLTPPGGGAPMLNLTSSPLGTSIGTCAQPDATFCYAGNSFVRVVADTASDRPSVLATFYDDTGNSLHEETALLTDLQ